MQYLFHTDPGHGWLEIQIADLEFYELTLLSFSGYSYVSHADSKVYLEEDRDAGLFIEAWQKKNPSLKFPLREIHTDYESFVRGLPRLPKK